MSCSRRIRIDPKINGQLHDGVESIRREQHLPDAFPEEVEAAAEKAAHEVRLPDLDRTDIPLVTLDPPSAMDLDQAMFMERRGDGYRVFYAIADVGAFVEPGGVIDREVRRRGETLYGADRKIPLHPKVLSEGAASLLPDQVRPCLLWQIDLDASGEGLAVDVRRARVKSRAKLDYHGMHAEITAGTAGPMWALLKEIGELRLAREQRRGGISLPLPEQEVGVVDDHLTLEYRGNLPIDQWNAQISLLTGMAAAHLMVTHKVGILRTLPPTPDWAIRRLHRTARALHIDWPDGQGYAAFLRSLDPSRPEHVAMMVSATTVFRGAGYADFRGSLPDQPEHSALAAEYAHATAPLRRLVDRFTGEVCLALCAGESVPQWVLDGLPDLPGIMRESGSRAGRYENAVLNLAETLVLQSQVGRDFEGAIVDLDHRHHDQGDIMIRKPAVEARIQGKSRLPLGERVRARLVEADPATRQTRFELAG
ncbi:MAG: RNB domain-containing ribonuclease [Rhodanobacteraceae bacterium]